MAFTAGVFLALNVLGRIAGQGGSRPALQLLALLTLAGIATMALIPDSPAVPGSGATMGFHPWKLGAGPWLLAIGYFGYSIGTEAYLSFTPDFLVEKGLALAVASSIVASYALIAFVLKPPLSSLLTRDRALPYVCAATAMAMVSISLLFLAVPPVVSAAAMGVSLALGMPSLLALPAFLLPASQSGQGYGLYQLLYSLGFFAQPLIGFVVDRTSAYSSGYVVIAGFTLLGLAVLTPAVRRLRA
jgi:hypothetical protein